MLLLTFRVDGLRLHPDKEPFCGGVVRTAALRTHRACQAESVHKIHPSESPVVVVAVGMDDGLLSVLERGTRVQMTLDRATLGPDRGLRTFSWG